MIKNWGKIYGAKDNIIFRLYLWSPQQDILEFRGKEKFTEGRNLPSDSYYVRSLKL